MDYDYDYPPNPDDNGQPANEASSAEFTGCAQYHIQCHDCGKFLVREQWVDKKHRWKKHALCLY